MRIGELVADLDACALHGDPNLEISAIEFDSRQVTPGSLFVALRGGYTDGHLYLDDASRRGATGVVVEADSGFDPSGFGAVVVAADTRALLATLASRFYGYPSHAMTVIGVTGTDGKTTTSHFIDAIMRHAGRTTGLIGTVAVRIGDAIDLHASRQTTPESLHVQRYLAQMRDYGVDVVVVEATSHGLELHRLDG